MISLPNPPKVARKKGNYAVIEIEPLYPGYAVTVGNSFRRVLLSSLEGSAITNVKIKGAGHEFSTIPGVLEDVIVILLNLKKIRFKNWSEEPQTISLKSKGEKEVKARDFQKNPQLEVVNPDCHIATVTDKKTEFQIEAVVEKGIGYSLSEEREEKKKEVGVIPVDAIFTPVRKVNFRVENVWVGKRADFEKLVLDIETDGTIAPEEAFFRAADILFGHFSLFAKAELGEKNKKKAAGKEVKEKEKSKSKEKGKIKGTAKKKKKEAKEAKEAKEKKKGSLKKKKVAVNKKSK